MARSEWAKLHAKVSESEDFANLYAQSPEAAALFLLSLPQAAPWGVLPGSPPLFAARVCPLLMLSREQAETSLRLIVESGLFTAYQGLDSKPLVYVTGWNKHQTRQWERCGLPEFDLPPQWNPPEGLGVAVCKAETEHRALSFVALSGRLTSEESKTSLRLACAAGGVSLAKREESLERGKTTKAKASAPPAATPPPEPDCEEPEKPKRTRRKTERDLAFEACLDVFAVAHDALDSEAWAAYAKAMGKVVDDTGLEQIVVWGAQEGAGTRKLGTGAKPERRIPSVVRKEITASEWQASFEKARGNGQHAGERFWMMPNGTKVWEKQWDLGTAEEIAAEEAKENWNPVTGRTIKDTIGWACSDEHPNGKLKTAQGALI